VTLVVTYSGWNTVANDAEVAAYVQSLQPAGGNCTLTMTLAGTTRTASKAASTDVSTTQCGTVAIPAGQLSTGTWTATVSYKSATASGVSAPVTIQVP
jgi:ABC-type molybdate transport system substrate-binding protein